MNSKSLFLFISLSFAFGGIVSIWLFQVEDYRPEPVEDPETRFYFMRTDLSKTDLNDEKALLLDSEPLFRPTFWNATVYADSISAPEDALPVFDDYPVVLHLDESSLLPREMLVSEPDFSYFYERSFWQAWRALGESDYLPHEASVAYLKVEVRRVSTSELVMEFNQAIDEELNESALISPASFLMKNWDGRRIGPIVMLSSSGSESWDELLKKKLPDLLFSMDLQGEFIILAGL